MKAALRRIFNAFVTCIPRPLLRGFLKAFESKPEIAEKAGFQVYPKVFYSPFPHVDELDRVRLEQKRDLPGIQLDTKSSLELLLKLQVYASELARFPMGQTAGELLWFENGTYAGYDAATLYAMLRHLKPKRYIEVGCGFSSRASTAALIKNKSEGFACEATYIEPYPSAQLSEIPLLGPLLKQKVQDIPLSTFQALQSGDVLFIDTSHVIRVQNDVEFEFLHILPSLQNGVWVHVHDIFTPYDYPMEWFTGPARGGNNKQYALECLLSGGETWKVELPVYLLWREFRTELEKLLPGAPHRPAAFWIRKT